MKTFRELGADPETAEALEAVGITQPFPVQELTIPLALAGNDVIGQAPTGTGKTIAFGIPLLQRISVPGSGLPEALVVVPTRELAVQVAGDLETGSGGRGVRILTVYGGRSYEPQIEGLASGVEVVVGTPGRLLDLAGRGVLDLSAVRLLVLDEADRMLDLGFLPDVERIIALTPTGRQTLLFSATMRNEVVSLSRRYLRQATQVNVEHVQGAGNPADAVVPEIRHLAYRTHQLDKAEVLARILQAEGLGRTMVFCRTRVAADMVASELKARGFKAAAVHGDLGQGDRERALRGFRNEQVDVLVATDVAARGLDVESVTHVINYDCPEDENAYLHRTGRSGRAGAAGNAVTFIDWADLPRWRSISTQLGLDLPDPAETYSTSPHLYADLAIPEGATGSLPGAPGPDAARRAGRDGDRRHGRNRRPDRGDKDRRGSGQRGERQGDEHAETGERPARRRRQRRRTRGGRPVDHAPQDGQQAASSGSTGQQADHGGSRTEGSAPRRRKRRRRRAGQDGDVRTGDNSGTSGTDAE